LIETVLAGGNYSEIDLSPEGTRLAFSQLDERAGSSDVWVHDLRRGTTSRLTFDPGDDRGPVWSPNGEEIAFSSNREGAYRTFIKFASGVGEERRVPGEAGGIHWAISWNRALDLLAVTHTSARADWDTKAMSPRDSAAAVVIAATPARDEFDPAISPDGRWVALTSVESGLPQVYVQSYPVPASRWQISIASGKDPAWRPDGRELFYRTITDSIMAVPILPGESFEWGTPRALFLAGAPNGPAIVSVWKPTADGQRFYVLRQQALGRPAPITVVLDWAAEAARKKAR
jgi:Tol biopolymer transport system component